MKDLINTAYQMGKEAFGKFSIAPNNNAEFMSIVPNCSIDDTKGCKLRVDMYKAYRKGWTQEHIKNW